ncbi:hypothetical protein E3N88_18455 [Mikania micrantha]|uniref:Uncharacterized protein n=1 Tax=Mikania micrantha TaxID=192012 RepID=A0A5N6NLV2_9ASTR|nr:hypothetical protein E3N88_18455 [Mikania micrantha]
MKKLCFELLRGTRRLREPLFAVREEPTISEIPNFFAVREEPLNPRSRFQVTGSSRSNQEVFLQVWIVKFQSEIRSKGNNSFYLNDFDSLRIKLSFEYYVMIWDD